LLSVQNKLDLFLYYNLSFFTKTMNYTRKKLDSLRNTKSKPIDFDDIVQVLVNKVEKDEEISLAEQQFVCGIVEMLKDENNIVAYDIHKKTSCKDYLFKNRYLLYHQDLNGHKKVINYDGEISFEKKKKDVAFLEKEYQEWDSFSKNKLSGSELINYVAQETNYQLKELDKYCDRLNIGSNLKKYLKKSIVLHGKYIFLLVKEFYQELGDKEEIIIVNDQKILIDAFTYVHTMFRHFAESIKEHQSGKSYHFDENIGFKIIPEFLSKILDCYKNIPESKAFNNKNLFIKFNGQIYALWFKLFSKYLKEQGQVKYFRLQTFYPVKNQSDLDGLVNHKEVKTNCGFIYLLP